MMLLNKHHSANPRAAPIESMGCIPHQREKEKSPRTMAGQRMDAFTVDTVGVNWRSPRGVAHFHPAFSLLAEIEYGQKRAEQALPAEFCREISWDSQDFADANKAKGAIFDPRTCLILIAASRGTPAYAHPSVAAVPYEIMLQ